MSGSNDAADTGTEPAMKTLTIKRNDLKDKKTISMLLAAGYMLQVAR